MNYKSRKLLARILLPMEQSFDEEESLGAHFSMDCGRLADLIGKQRKLLILDCRPFLAFSDGHILGAVNVHCPSILRRRSRGQILPLRTLIPADEVRNRLLSQSHDSFEKVILYDDKSCDLDISDDSMLKLVSKCLQFEGRSFEVYFLTGGFRGFKQHYPHLSSIKSSSTPSFGTNYNDSIFSSVLKSNNCNSQSSDSPVEILPHLYLGNARHASRKDVLKRLGITALMNVSPRTCPNYFEGSFTYKSINIDDTISADIGVWFPEAIAFIDSVMAVGGKVLVHCHAGVSRSATICLAYIMAKCRLHLDEAFELVRSKRSVISPNLGFMDQLLRYESQVFSSSPLITSHICRSGADESQPSIAGSEPRPSSLPSKLSPSCQQQVFNFDFATSCPTLPSSPIFSSFCSTPRTILSPS